MDVKRALRHVTLRVDITLETLAAGDMIDQLNAADFDQPVYQSVRNNNFEPVVMTFDITAFNTDSTALVFDVGALFTTDVEMIGALSKTQRKDFEIKSLDGKRSFITSAKSFPQNVEIRHILTYSGSKLPDNAVFFSGADQLQPGRTTGG